MKRLVVLMVIASVFGLSACNKCFICTDSSGNDRPEFCAKDKDVIESFKTDCKERRGGTVRESE